ncbi:MAG: OmpA family protein, partial [bacterium]
MNSPSRIRILSLVVSIFMMILEAQGNPFEPGWTLQTEASTLRFQSIKNNDKVESSSFATLSGEVSTTGEVTIKVLLDSVDTDVDLRNVRMRFLFFETFQYPEATISLNLDPAILADLPEVRRKVETIAYTLDLHGVSQNFEADLAFTQISEDLISVTTSAPITLSVTDFNLSNGIRKLEEAASVTILPSTNITFDFLFTREEVGAQSKPATNTDASAIAALETQGDFSLEACKGRFEILSRTDNIYFKFGSAELDPQSRLILDSIVDIVRRCPGLTIEVSGHTDSDGPSPGNQVLSEARANQVKIYLSDNGIESDRIIALGYGESQPVAPNDSAEN